MFIAYLIAYSVFNDPSVVKAITDGYRLVRASYYNQQKYTPKREFPVYSRHDEPYVRQSRSLSNGQTSKEPYSDNTSAIYEEASNSVVIAIDSTREPRGGGFIVDTDNLIVTASHVAIDDTMTFRLKNGKEYKSKVIYRDKTKDIAILRAKSLTQAGLKLGDRPRIGQKIMVIGHPYSYTYTLSIGIVSAADRQIPMTTSQMVKVTQISAAVNIGNSGGPVIDHTGKVVGMILAIHNRGQGMSFMLPVADIKAALDAIAQP